MGEQAGGGPAEGPSPETLLDVAWHSLADEADVLQRLGTSRDGLSAEEAADRLKR
jgi:hypothetical protein